MVLGQQKLTEHWSGGTSCGLVLLPSSRSISANSPTTPRTSCNRLWLVPAGYLERSDRRTPRFPVLWFGVPGSSRFAVKFSLKDVAFSVQFDSEHEHYIAGGHGQVGCCCCSSSSAFLDRSCPLAFASLREAQILSRAGIRPGWKNKQTTFFHSIRDARLAYSPWIKLIGWDCCRKILNFFRIKTELNRWEFCNEIKMADMLTARLHC